MRIGGGIGGGASSFHKRLRKESRIAALKRENAELREIIQKLLQAQAMTAGKKTVQMESLTEDEKIQGD